MHTPKNFPPKDDLRELSVEDFLSPIERDVLNAYSDYAETVYQVVKLPKSDFLENLTCLSMPEIIKASMILCKKGLLIQNQYGLLSFEISEEGTKWAE